MVLAQDASQVNRSKQIQDDIQYRKDVAKYEADLKAYEAEKARVEEENKKAKEKYEADLKVWQAQEAERKKKEQQSRWSGYDSQITQYQNQIKSLQRKSEQVSKRSVPNVAIDKGQIASQIRNVSQELHNEQVRMRAYGGSRGRAEKVQALQSQLAGLRTSMNQSDQVKNKQNELRNIGQEIKNLQIQLSKTQERKAGAVAQYQAKQKLESQARSAITSAGNEYAYRKAVWDYRNTDFVSSRGLAKPYMTSAVSSALREYSRAQSIGKGSSINRAYSKAEFAFMGGSQADWNARIQAEDRNRKLAKRMSASLRASGNRQIQSAIDKEMERLGGGTMVSGTLTIGTNVASRVPVASGTAEKAQDFGKGFTYETRAFGYVASGQAEIDRQQQIAKYEREQKLKAAGLDPNVPAGGMDMILNQPVLVTQTSQLAEPSKPRTPEERFEARKQGVLSATQQEQKAMKAFAELNKPQEVARYTPFVVGDKGFFSERAAINYANQINADPTKTGYTPAGSDILGTGFREIQTNTKPVSVDKSVNQKNFVAPYLIPVEQRSFIGYGQDGKPIQGSPVPQGRFTVITTKETTYKEGGVTLTVKSPKDRTFKDYLTAQKFIQRTSQPKAESVQTPLSLSQFATQDMIWKATSPATGEVKEFSNKKQAEEYLAQEQKKLPLTAKDGVIIPYQEIYKFADEKNTRLQEKLKKDPDNIGLNLVAATGTTIALGLDAITEGGKALDKYLINPTRAGMEQSLLPLVEQPKATRPVTMPIQTLESAGYEQLSKDSKWIPTSLGVPRLEVRDDPFVIGGAVTSFVEGAYKQSQKQGWVQTGTQLLVLAPQVFFDARSVGSIFKKPVKLVTGFGLKSLLKPTAKVAKELATEYAPAKAFVKTEPTIVKYGDNVFQQPTPNPFGKERVVPYTVRTTAQTVVEKLRQVTPTTAKVVQKFNPIVRPVRSFVQQSKITAFKFQDKVRSGIPSVPVPQSVTDLSNQFRLRVQDLKTQAGFLKTQSQVGISKGIFRAQVPLERTFQPVRSSILNAKYRTQIFIMEQRAKITKAQKTLIKAKNNFITGLKRDIDPTIKGTGNVNLNFKPSQFKTPQSLLDVKYRVRLGLDDLRQKRGILKRQAVLSYSRGLTDTKFAISKRVDPLILRAKTELSSTKKYMLKVLGDGSTEPKAVVPFETNQSLRNKFRRDPTYEAFYGSSATKETRFREGLKSSELKPKLLRYPTQAIGERAFVNFQNKVTGLEKAVKEIRQNRKRFVGIGDYAPSISPAKPDLQALSKFQKSTINLGQSVPIRKGFQPVGEFIPSKAPKSLNPRDMFRFKSTQTNLGWSKPIKKNYLFSRKGEKPFRYFQDSLEGAFRDTRPKDKQLFSRASSKGRLSEIVKMIAEEEKMRKSARTDLKRIMKGKDTGLDKIQKQSKDRRKDQSKMDKERTPSTTFGDRSDGGTIQNIRGSGQTTIQIQKPETVIKVLPKSQKPEKISESATVGSKTKDEKTKVTIIATDPKLKRKKIEPRRVYARDTVVVETEYTRLVPEGKPELNTNIGVPKVSNIISAKSISRLGSVSSTKISTSVSPKLDTKISSKLDTRISSKLDTKISSKLDTRISSKLDTKISQALDQKQPQALKSPTPQKPKVRQLARPKSLRKPKARLAFKAPNTPPLRQRIPPAILPPIDVQKKKEQKKDSKKRKRVEFIGNVKLDDIEGLIKRETIITGSKKVRRAERKGKKAKPQTFKVGFWKL